jgi:hypothetical protein
MELAAAAMPSDVSRPEGAVPPAGTVTAPGPHVPGAVRAEG